MLACLPFALWHMFFPMYVCLFKDTKVLHRLLLHLYLYIIYNLWLWNFDSGFHEWESCFPEYYEHHISGC